MYRLGRAWHAAATCKGYPSPLGQLVETYARVQPRYEPLAPTPAALPAARQRRNALLVPAKAGRCWYEWQTAARHAADVVRYLEDGRPQAAANAETGYRQCYRYAAGCEGLAVPPGAASCSQYASGLSNYVLADDDLPGLHKKVDELLAKQRAEERYRKFATIAAIGGAIFAAMRLGLIAVPFFRRRRRPLGALGQ
jgi:hypothetical protein